jgi:hypothetical protein
VRCLEPKISLPLSCPRAPAVFFSRAAAERIELHAVPPGRGEDVVAAVGEHPSTSDCALTSSTNAAASKIFIIARARRHRSPGAALPRPPLTLYH